MAHGYLGDGYGEHGDAGRDRSDDQDHRRRDRDRSEGSRQAGGEWRDRDQDRGMMFGGGRSDRGWSNEDRWSDRGRRGEQQRDFGGGDYGEDRRSFSANPDDHYRSWRERHMSELDRDYADYCREREQAFHQDFDAWRSQRHASYQPLRTGMTQSGMSHDPSGELQLTTEASADRSAADPMADATLGTNTESSTGRGKR